MAAQQLCVEEVPSTVLLAVEDLLAGCARDGGAVTSSPCVAFSTCGNCPDTDACEGSKSCSYEGTGSGV